MQKPTHLLNRNKLPFITKTICMKQSIQSAMRKIQLFCLTLLLTSVAFAQDSAMSATTTTSTSSTTERVWYMEPWAWIVGGIILLLIIFLAARGNGDKSTTSDRVTVTKTVSRDSDVV